MEVHKLSQTKDNPRTWAIPLFEYKLQKRLTDATYIDDWPADAAVEIRSKGGMDEDMPWWVDGSLGSDRFRKVVESVCPDDAQFLPLRLVYHDRPKDAISPGRYWLVNWLRQVDCLDYERSNSPLRSTISGTVIDLSRVPDDAVVFRIKQAMSAVHVTPRFLSALKTAGITGWSTMSVCQF